MKAKVARPRLLLFVVLVCLGQVSVLACSSNEDCAGSPDGKYCVKVGVRVGAAGTCSFVDPAVFEGDAAGTAVEGPQSAGGMPPLLMGAEMMIGFFLLWI